MDRRRGQAWRPAPLRKTFIPATGRRAGLFAMLPRKVGLFRRSDFRVFIRWSVCVFGVALTAGLVAGTRPVIMATRGVVVTGHHRASDAGIEMLKKGGNAVDAGVAAVFAQAVVEFDRFGLGGEVPILIYLAEQEKVISLNGHGFAPRRATIEWFRERNIDYVPGDGFLGAVVPPGKRVRSGEVWAGVPAKFLRPVTAEERAWIAESADHYCELAAAYLNA